MAAISAWFKHEVKIKISARAQSGPKRIFKFGPEPGQKAKIQILARARPSQFFFKAIFSDLDDASRQTSKMCGQKDETSLSQ